MSTTWRKLEESRTFTAFGALWLELTVARKSGGGRSRALTTRYLVEHHAAGAVTLVTDEGKRYEVTPHACSCPHAGLFGKRLVCKHRAACYRHRLFSGFSAEKVS